jgi:hypothetical protein
MEKIHESSRIKYIRMVGELTYATRINLYKVLGSLDWSDFYCAFMLELFDHVGKERRELLIHTTVTLYGNRYVVVAVEAVEAVDDYCYHVFYY